jgi:hypothetical protein
MIVGHLDLDEPIDQLRVAPRRLRALLQRRKQIQIQLRILPRRGDIPIRDPTRELRRQRPRRRDIDRDHLLRPVIDRRAIGLVVLALKRHPLLAPEPADQIDRLAHHHPPLLRPRPLRPRRRRLIQRLTGPHPKKHPTRMQTRQRGEILRHDRRVIPHRRRQHRLPNKERSVAPPSPPTTETPPAYAHPYAATAESDQRSRSSPTPTPPPNASNPTAHAGRTARPTPYIRNAGSSWCAPVVFWVVLAAMAMRLATPG